ncbi:MAG: 30S ribosomal protein S12 methylthiotransferase RimO [Candidatus Krumholzibacteriota bacterium]|nr:30S ribosomal protein S12 methylthiotransferase RimO [Candidatus Krumholzibacteriota bacterium]
MKAEDRESQLPSYFFFNLGCPKNIADAELTASRLDEAGWRPAPSPSQARLLVITTCAFISAAEEESINEILRVASGKRDGQKLAVLGCLVSREGEALRELLPEVDIFLPVERMRFLPERLAGEGEDRFEEEIERAEEGAIFPRRNLFTPAHLAYLKIAEGCSNHCSYCTIPSIRGELASRPREDILREVSAMTSRGVKEIVVVAQDTCAWGRDRENGRIFTDLLEDILKLPGLEWIRLMYLHPAHLDAEGLVPLMREGAIVPYLDIPLQHVSDRILQRMGRNYRRSDLERLFYRLRSGIEDLVLRTTVMVGFPGETEREFEELLGFLEEFRLDHVGIFSYSPEKGTPAWSGGERVGEDTLRGRTEELTAAQMDISQDKLQEAVGRTYRVLVDEKFEGGNRPAAHIWGTGRYYGQAYEIDGLTYLSGAPSEPGSFLPVRIERADVYDLFGSVKKNFI